MFRCEINLVINFKSTNLTINQTKIKRVVDSRKSITSEYVRKVKLFSVNGIVIYMYNVFVKIKFSHEIFVCNTSEESAALMRKREIYSRNS